MSENPSSENPSSENPSPESLTPPVAAAGLEVERKLPKGRMRKWVRNSLIALLALLVAVVGFYVIYPQIQLAAIPRDGSMMPNDYPGRPASAPGAMNVLVLGSDLKEDSPEGRTDMMMVVHLPPGHDKVDIISIPRATFTMIPGFKKTRINSSFERGGPAMSVLTVEQFLGTRIDHVALIDFEGFINLTTALGGVTVYNPVESTTIHKIKYHFPVGEVTIQGDQALEYVRDRNMPVNGELIRAERGRTVMKAIMEKLLKADVLANPIKFASILQQVSTFVKVDAGMTDEVIKGTALSMKISGSKDIRLFQVPIERDTTIKELDGLWVQIPDKAQLAELTTALNTDGMNAYYEKYKNQTFKR